MRDILRRTAGAGPHFFRLISDNLRSNTKSYELEQRRIALEEKRYALMKQKISGEYDVDPDTGEIDDSYTKDSEDGEV